MSNERVGNEQANKYIIPVQAVVAVLVIIFIVDLIGNSIVVLIVVKKRRMQTFTNWLILNLAIADLLVALICIPLEIPLEIKGGLWIYGEGFCTVFYPIQTATIYGSVFTLVALSSSRYWAIIHPFRRQPTVRTAKVLIGIIWICSVIVVIPYMVTLKYENGSCIETWTAGQRRIYTIALFTFQFVLPILTMCAAYMYIAHELFRKNNDTITKMDKRKYSETKKVVKLLVVVTVTFACCVLPHHVFSMVNEFGVGDFPHSEDFYLSGYLLICLNSAINPIIYNVFNERFNKSFIQLYRKLIKRILRSSSDDYFDTNSSFSLKQPSIRAADLREITPLRECEYGRVHRTDTRTSACSDSTTEP